LILVIKEAVAAVALRITHDVVDFDASGRLHARAGSPARARKHRIGHPTLDRNRRRGSPARIADRIPIVRDVMSPAGGSPLRGVSRRVSRFRQRWSHAYGRRGRGCKRSARRPGVRLGRRTQTPARSMRCTRDAAEASRCEHQVDAWLATREGDDEARVVAGSAGAAYWEDGSATIV